MIQPYTAEDRQELQRFLMDQRTFARLNEQTVEMFRDENVADFEEEGTISLIFREEERIVAIADLLKKHPIDGSLWLGLFVVEESLHGTGLAQTLYEQLEDQYMRPYQMEFRLGVLPHNVRARRFWERNGYVYEKDSITNKGTRVHVLKKRLIRSE
ncbi:GNAT family N-acetyltransferase [Exiguobacterium sp. PBE]|uniref:GNAT family N-acetyltransferase n=1 Tax=unclassified Exiguobacterium TaxID=2644629 RepID=UPI0018DABEB7|nr:MULTISPECIES: GNAT family N-acetyltransferase [unclassified Exiguobacterium]MDT0192653.1 GNAT family N-acetyltransferase [Exiguobacterium sp. BG5(2022)]QPI68053.1 GNAT family N-acetyltransferase [Exiguobacterium sp. PBE]